MGAAGFAFGGARRLVRLVLLAMVVCAAAGTPAGAATTANAGSFSWSAPYSLDHSGGSQLSGVSCPATTQCTAVDFHGDEVTFDPTSPTPNHNPQTIDSGKTLTAVACPSTTQCTAVGGHSEVTFDPTSATPNSTPRTVDSSKFLLAVACPSTTQCTAVGQDGDEVTFDPTATTPNNTARTVDSGTELDGVTCPSATQCTAVGQGDEVTFDPTSTTPNSMAHMVDAVNRWDGLAGVACPSLHQCTAVGVGGNEVTFDPTSATPNNVPRTVAAGQYPSAVACTSTTQCIAVDSTGGEVTFDPTAAVPNSTPQTVDGTQLLSGVACPSATQCTAVDIVGGAVTFTPSSTMPNGTPHTVDGDRNLDGLACPTTTQCTAVDYGDGADGREVTFDPTSSTPNSAPRTIDSDPLLSGVACPSATQCTAVDGHGGEVTFDPTSTTPNSAPHTVDSGQFLYGIACPSTTQCTGVDGSGGEVTFDPRSTTPNSGRHVVDSGQYLFAVACPSVSQCTAADGFGGGEVTFDPTAATPNALPQTIDGGQYVDGIACPSATQCTAVDSSGNEVTFDPTSATPNSTADTVDSGGYLNSVACPSATQCTAVDGGGSEVTFDPTSATPNSAPYNIRGANSLNSIACVSAVECVAVDSAGNGVTGRVPADPTLAATAPSTGTAGSAIDPSSVSATLSGSASASGTITFRVFGPQSSAPTDCTSGGTTVGTASVSGDGTYHPSSAFTPSNAGTYWWYAAYGGDAGNDPAASSCGAVKTVVAPASPMASAPPTVSGTAQQGQTLTEAHGQWSPPPSSYAYQWQDCDSTGGACQAITGATEQTYVLTASDVGHTIRVIETASTAGGSAHASSPATGVVTAPAPADVQIDTTGQSTRSDASVNPGVTLSCPAGGAACTVTETASVLLGTAITPITPGHGTPHTETIGQASFTIPAGSSIPASFTLNPDALTLLSDHPSLPVQLTLTGQAHDQPAITATKTITLTGQSAHYHATHLRLHRDGSITLTVTTSTAGQINLLASAWTNNIAHAAPRPVQSDHILNPAPQRFTYARQTITTTTAKTISITLHPTAQAQRLTTHPAYTPTLRLWVSYIPLYAYQTDTGYYGLHPLTGCQNCHTRVWPPTSNGAAAP